MSVTFFNPNSVFAGFDDDFFSPLAPSAFHGVPPTLTRFKDDTMRHFSPRYEVTENAKQFRLAIEVPGVKEDNMKVELENNGRFLHLSFIKKEKTDTTFTEFKFDKRFSLGKNLDTSKLTANLSDGVLVLTAPKKVKVPPASQEIPITRGEPPALMER